MYSIWVESSLNQLSDIKGIIKTLSLEEDKEYFDPHVTLVTNLKTERSATVSYTHLTLPTKA